MTCWPPVWVGEVKPENWAGNRWADPMETLDLGRDVKKPNIFSTNGIHETFVHSWPAWWWIIRITSSNAGRLPLEVSMYPFEWRYETPVTRQYEKSEVKWQELNSNYYQTNDSVFTENQLQKAHLKSYSITERNYCSHFGIEVFLAGVQTILNTPHHHHHLSFIWGFFY